MTYVGYGVLESSTGSGAAMAGRAMLAARRSCVICMFVIFAKVRVDWVKWRMCRLAREGEIARLDGRQSLYYRKCAFCDLWRS